MAQTLHTIDLTLYCWRLRHNFSRLVDVHVWGKEGGNDKMVQE